MAHTRIAISPGQPFNINANNVSSSVSGSWVLFGEASIGKAVRVQGVYWTSATPGAVLRIRDIHPGVAPGNRYGKPGAVWYEAICIGGNPALDLFPAHLTLFSPFEYYESGSFGSEIAIYGEYM